MPDLTTDLAQRRFAGYPDSVTLVGRKGEEVMSPEGLFPIALPTPRYVTSTPVVDTSILASGDSVAAKLTRIDGASRTDGAQRGSPRTTVLQQINVIDNAVQSAALELWFFDTESITLPTVNNAWSISDAHAARCLGWVAIPAANYAASALNSVAVVKQIGQSLRSTEPSGKIWYAIVSRGTPTYAAASDLTFQFTFYPDA